MQSSTSTPDGRPSSDIRAKPNGTSALVVKVYVNVENVMCAQRLPCARGREKRRVRCGRCGTAPRHEKSVSLLPAEPSLV